MKKAVIFDFDFTLGDSAQGIAVCANHALAILGHSARPFDDIRRTIGLTLEESYTRLTGDRDPSRAAQFATLFKKRADSEITKSAYLYDGVIEMLSSLKSRGVKTGIVTTKYHFRIDEILNKFNVAHLIDVIVGSDEVKNPKPDPESLLFAIEKLSLTPSDILYVGDSTVDAMCAERAGVDFAAVLTGTTGREELERYPHVYIGDNIRDTYDFIIL